MTTAGGPYREITEGINLVDPSILSFFKNNRLLVDYSGREVEFIHMMATLSAHYFDSSPVHDDLLNDLAGWGGDLQSLIEDLKLNGVGKKGDRLKQEALALMKKDDTNFSPYDFISDVDAFNIYRIYGEGTLFSDAFASYYVSDYKSRYRTFIDEQGGLGNLEKRARDYTTQGEDFVKHNILNGSAQEAYNQSPKSVKKKVSADETEALTYAFIQRLKELR